MTFNGLYGSVVWGGPEPESHDIVEDAIRKEQVLKSVVLSCNIAIASRTDNFFLVGRLLPHKMT